MNEEKMPVVKSACVDPQVRLRYRKYMEVLMKLNINGIMDTTYSYGNERLTIERFDGWTGYYTYDPDNKALYDK